MCQCIPSVNLSLLEIAELGRCINMGAPEDRTSPLLNKHQPGSHSNAAATLVRGYALGPKESIKISESSVVVGRQGANLEALSEEMV